MRWVVMALLLSALTVAAAPFDPPRALAVAVEAVQRSRCEPLVNDLRHLADEATPDGARAAFLLGHCLRQMRRIDESRDVFRAVADRHPTLRGYALYYAAQASLVVGDAPGAIGLLESTTVGPSPALARRVDLLRGEALLRAGRPADAAAVLRGLTRAVLDDAARARTWWLLGEAAEATGDRSTSARAYAMTWWGIPGNPYSTAAESRLRRIAHGPPVPSAEARLARALWLLAAAELGAAGREFARALHAGLPAEDGASAWFHLGMLRLGTAAAVQAFRQSSLRAPHADRALFWWGAALVAIGRQPAARDVWQRLFREHPASAWTARAMLALGLRAEAARHWADAERWYLRLAREHASSPSADEARWRLGWMRFRRGRYADAEQLFLRYAKALPATPRAPAHLYWAARARERQGRSGRALLNAVAERYPFSFYGQRARIRLGLAPPKSIPPPPPAERPGESYASPYAELAALGFAREAADAVEATTPLRDAAVLYARAGDVDESVAAAEQLATSGLYGGAPIDVDTWKLAYPRAFWPMVVDAGHAHGVDPYLVLAVMREESRFDPRAVSPAGAAGLMQLLPSTASGISGTAVSPAELTDPKRNLSAGVAYLGGLLRRFGGSVPLAVAAYNAGPGAVRRSGGLARGDLDQFVEGFPFAETRAYVQRVLQSYGIYRWVYGGASGVR